MRIDRLDHLVLTVHDMDKSIDFYTRVLGMTAVTFGASRRALNFGQQKINLHPINSGISLVARHPTPGSGDLCFITSVPLDEVIAHLQTCGVAIEGGPTVQTGATGDIRSVYFRDPDGNLVEVSNLMEATT